MDVLLLLPESLLRLRKRLLCGEILRANLQLVLAFLDFSQPILELLEFLFKLSEVCFYFGDAIPLLCYGLVTFFLVLS